MKRITFLLSLFSLLSFQILQAQTTVTGTVTSAEDGEPIPGASVLVQGVSGVGTVTDFEGNYSLDVPAEGEVLVFSFTGMAKKEVEIDGRSTINVALEAEDIGLEEVVVTAYGTSRKQSFTGSADVVSEDKIERQNISSISKGLEGNAPGIQVSNSSGQPGANASIRIRGFGSVNAASSPLYVVDGVPYEGDINAINPQDIQNISVLKDATATSLYGARGANGVIMITTKSGKGEEPELNYRFKQGFSARAYPEYKQVDSREYVELMWESYRNALHYAQGFDKDEAGQIAAQGDEENASVIGNLGGYNPFDVAAGDLIDPETGEVDPNANLLWGNNWQDVMFRDGDRQEHQVSFTGSTDKTNYYMSLGYLEDNGIVENSNFDRFTGRVNVESQLTDWLQGGFNMSGATADQNYFLAEGTYTVNPFYYTRFMGPIYPVYERDEDGNIVTDEQGEQVLDYGSHPDRVRPYAANSNILGQTTLDNRNTKTENVSSRFFVKVDILKDFQFETNLAVDYSNDHIIDHQNSEHGDASGFSGRTEMANARNIGVNLNQLLRYNKEFGQHDVDFLLGHEAYTKNYNYLTATRTGFPFGGLQELATASTMEASNSYKDEYRIEGYFSRLKYNFADRYYITGSYRRDGSSRFHEDTRWGNFWSIGGSWRLSEEDFLSGLDMLTDFKLKASYGEQGNDRLMAGGSSLYYGYQSFYQVMNNYSYSGFIISSLPNKDLQWEVSENLNAGIEFNFFDRFRGEVNYFVKGSSALLFDNPLAMSTGLNFVKDNVGAMENKGIEAQLSVDIIQTNDLRWNVAANVTSFKNELTELPQEEIITGSKKLMVGKSIYDYFIRESAGVDPETGEALYWNDVMEDGEPTGEREKTTDYAEADRYYVGTAVPDMTGSFSSSLDFKGFSFSFMLTYGLGGEMMNYTYMRMMHAGDYGTHWHENIKDRWQEPGDVTDVPKLQNGYDFANNRSDRFLVDKSYLNIKNVSLSYTLPKEYLSFLGGTVKGLSVFASGDNLYLFSELQGMNPQESFSGVTDYQYTPAKTMTIGANIKF